MVRIAKDPDERRSELIASARKLFYSKGYETTSVSDIVDDVGVAKGTFYYYFDSKQAVMEALVDDIIQQSSALLDHLVADETLPVLVKWKRAMHIVSEWKAARKPEMLEILRVVRMPENILLQHRVRTQSIKMLAPVFAKIIAQGVAEGVFHTDFVEQSAAIMLAMMMTLADPFYDILLRPQDYQQPQAVARQHWAAVETAIERVLGAPEGSLSLVDEQTLAVWFEEHQPATGDLGQYEAVVSMEQAGSV